MQDYKGGGGLHFIKFDFVTGSQGGAILNFFS